MTQLHVEYPVAGGSVPAQDAASWQKLLKVQRQRLATIEGWSSLHRLTVQPDEQPLTTARMAAIANALGHNLNAIDNVLQPLTNSASALSLSIKRLWPVAANPYSSLSPHTVGHINLSNLRYLFRDWSVGEHRWGQPETEAMLSALAPALALVDNGCAVVAAGAGAMRLPLEVARQLRATECCCIELDALLCHASASLLSGATLKLYEMPTEPSAEVAVLQTLAVPAGEWANCPSRILCGDANGLVPDQLAKMTSQSLLFTPFIIDVAGGDILQRCTRWAAALPSGARWLNIGPVSVREPQAKENYGVDEVRARLQQAGLEIEYEQQLRIPHLNSAHNRRHQSYQCWVFLAKKKPGS